MLKWSSWCWRLQNQSWRFSASNRTYSEEKKIWCHCSLIHVCCSPFSFCRKVISLKRIQFAENKAGFMATEVPCGWAGAIFEIIRPFRREQWGQRNKIIKKIKWPTDRRTKRVEVACTRLKIYDKTVIKLFFLLLIGKRNPRTWLKKLTQAMLGNIMKSWKLMSLRMSSCHDPAMDPWSLPTWLPNLVTFSQSGIAWGNVEINESLAKTADVPPSLRTIVRELEHSLKIWKLLLLDGINDYVFIKEYWC